MAGSSLLTVPSNLESPLMYEIAEHQGSSGASGADTSSSSLGSSVTACKKVLCSDSPLESTDYWLRNQRTLCRIDFVEDKSESNCASICFVNLAVEKEDYSHDKLRKKLISVSPDLPKLMSCMNVQQPKENEIVLLSGLSAGNLQAGLEVPQCPWLGDVCLVQCAKPPKNNSTNCIIFEINKFLIGLESVQKRQLQLDATILKPEDDTNCSVSSIEEDFLTASEHLDDDNEEDVKIDQPEPPSDLTKAKSKVSESFTCKRGRLPFNSEENYAAKFNVASCETSLSSDETLKETSIKVALKSLDKEHCNRTIELCCKGLSTGTNTAGQKSDTAIQNTCNFRNSAIDAQEVIPLVPQKGFPHSEPDGTLQTADESEHATAGQYATNLAESVLQDAFIRLSQPDPPFTEEAAVCISAGDSLLSASNLKEDTTTASLHWQELPKIVIVQSPDSNENVPEWPEPNLPPWQESQSSVDAPDIMLGVGESSGSPQNALEVALACAAAVIGTITSPHAAERIKIEQENMEKSSKIIEEQGGQTENVQKSEDEEGEEYSLPSAICGMTQVASAVAVCGLDEQKDSKYPVTASGLLAAADATAAITLHCSIAIGSSLESVNDSIAEVLLKEASLILNTPSVYKNVGDFIESINGRIIESVTSPRVSRVDEVSKDEVAQKVSNVIINHSVQECNRKQRDLHPSAVKTSVSGAQDIFMETASDLLFNVIYSTCKKMNDVALSEELAPDIIEERSKWRSIDETDTQQTKPIDSPPSRQEPDSSKSNCEHEQGRSTSLFDQSEGRPNLSERACSQGEETSEKLIRHNMVNARISPTKGSTIAEGCKVQNKKSKERRSFFARGSANAADESRYGAQEQTDSDPSGNTEPQENQKIEPFTNNDVQVSVSLLSNCVLGKYPSQPVLQVTHSTDYYCVADFAEELAETVVSMATEIAAICLENSNGKQPWFCSWVRGNDYLMPQGLSCRAIKRKKEAPPNGSVTRKHRPPRLSEIKRKTDEHPELKERLMNRVVDDSINLEDGPDSVNIFANEVASRIMNLTELPSADNGWQGQNLTRNRLHCERWNRGKASSYESIPEEDSHSNRYVNTLGPMSILGQPFSRTGSVSKQSSCESITDEFSRFMVNQMEDEGRDFDLLLDYYAGKNANNILHSAMQQVTRKNGHLNVRPSCPSKQSSTESITEEFYRYMLQEIDKDNKDSLSRRNSRDWSYNLLPPSPRTPLSFRQSSMPDSRVSNLRLTVNAPVKANSLDGGSQNSSRDFLRVQPVSAGPSSGLCKSDSCLYQRCRNDEITDMLIHETWKNSIEALMRKNKIITDNTDTSDPEDTPNGSPLHVEKYANRLAADIVQSGKSLIIVHQDSFDYTSKESDSRYVQTMPQCQPEPLTGGQGSGKKKGSPTSSAPPSACPFNAPPSTREVPLIQIETDQREASDWIASVPCNSAGRTKDIASKEKKSENYCEKSPGTSSFPSHSLRTRSTTNPESFAEAKPMDELPAHPSSSDESTGSWSQLANDEDNPDDASSYLQLSERSISNGNSSTSSSLGIVDLDICQEILQPCRVISALSEDKTYFKDQQENPDDGTSGLSVETASCHKDLLLINYDIEPDWGDAELRTTLQWIAASELGIPTIYFRKCQEKHAEKFLDVVHLVQQKSWKVGDVFKAVIQFCKLQETSREPSLSLFDWLLELG
ncbi:A-kinase anchor protein SPHKAP [Ambystoma mexicanum]|uniref:A-kinase anchor protein SPHKAP n=1 Tax=Ambystoma mexicanum TaxID=8296 RepID=UPI0037E95C37